MAGSYPRFLQRLQFYAANFEEVHVCTFDTRDYTTDWGLPNAFHHAMPPVPAASTAYHLVSPLIHSKALRHTTVVRTFNITGAIPAFLLRLFCQCPVFVSYGYSLPDFVRFESGWLKYWLYRLMEWIALRGSDYIICATSAQRDLLAARYGPQKMVLVPNLVDTDRFSPLLEAQRENHLLFVGRLVAQKNLDGLFKGLRLAADQGLSLPLKVVGQGEQELTLQALAAELGLNVAFLGVVPNDRLPDIYARAWAFVLPSHFEGMPKALLEAMSCGTPCLGADVEGISDLLVDGGTGVLVDPSPESIAAGLLRLSGDADLRRRIGQEARRFVVNEFSLAQVLSREIEILQGASR